MPSDLTAQQIALIDCLLQREALRFGDFTLKSGKARILLTP